MRALNIGSLNIDYVYRVPHFVQPGETLSSSSFEVHPGGKGLNQSIALARAGMPVAHFGAVGKEGAFLIDCLAASGVDVRDVAVVEEISGHAIIQVNAAGQNSILLHSGANAHLDAERIGERIRRMQRGDLLLMQNETNGLVEAVSAAKRSGLLVAINAAPFTEELLRLPLESVDFLFVNELEAQALAQSDSEAGAIEKLSFAYPNLRLIVTVGARGVRYQQGDVALALAAEPVKAVDTTAAGDTFTGFFLAGFALHGNFEKALREATRAAGICVTRPGAAHSIPTRAEIEAIR